MTIRQKQWQLHYLGYYFESIDGKWRTASKTATEMFQQDNGLEADGIFGPLTEAKSVAVVMQIQKAVGTTEDGLAGPDTVAATMVYQTSRGLEADGIAGPLTRAKIQEEASRNLWEEIKHFDREEFRCKCGGKYCSGFPAEPHPLLVKVADRVRAYFGTAAVVSSGVRCKDHNADVGGVSNSRHLQGKAMDFCVSGRNAEDLLSYVKNQPEIAYCYDIDETYIHMDVE